MSKIEKLTKEQENLFPVYRDRWVKIGLSTEAADRKKAESAIIDMYRYGGLKPPKKIIWCGSPLSQGLTRAIILNKKTMASVRDSVRDSVGDSVRDSVRDSVGASVWDSAGASVGDSVWDSVGAYISSFFDIPKWKYIDHEEGVNPFQPCIDLWNMGLVPSFDGTTWRLHGGKKAEILYELKSK